MAKLLLFVSVVCALTLSLTSQATVYTVGDTAGWDISADLVSWAENKTFYVGDALLFQYSSYHTLNEVDKAGYDACRATNAVLTGTDGNTTVPLTTVGSKYFICGVLSHCLGGMKLQAHVQRGNATAAAAAAPAPSPQSPEAQPDSPPSLARPSPNDNDPSSTPASSNGFLHGAGASRFWFWLCTTGALLWAIAIGGVNVI